MSVEAVSTITAKGQTTVPKAVRRALGVDVGGRISFRIYRDVVTLQRADVADRDPAIERFLAFLAADLERRPEAIDGLARALKTRLIDLTRNGDIDLSAAIEGEVAL